MYSGQNSRYHDPSWQSIVCSDLCRVSGSMTLPSSARSHHLPFTAAMRLCGFNPVLQLSQPTHGSAFGLKALVFFLEGVEAAVEIL